MLIKKTGNTNYLPTNLISYLTVVPPVTAATTIGQSFPVFVYMFKYCTHENRNQWKHHPLLKSHAR